jgi:hypothetical protein
MTEFAKLSRLVFELNIAIALMERWKGLKIYEDIHEWLGA